jgi:hypothetical protein
MFRFQDFLNPIEFGLAHKGSEPSSFGRELFAFPRLCMEPAPIV